MASLQNAARSIWQSCDMSMPFNVFNHIQSHRISDSMHEWLQYTMLLYVIVLFHIIAISCARFYCSWDINAWGPPRLYPIYVDRICTRKPCSLLNGLTAPGVEEHGDYANSNLGSEPQLWLWSPMSATVKTWYMWHGHPTIAGIIVGNP